MDERPGILELLDTTGTDGWPMIGWNGSSYNTVRWD